MGEVGGGGGGWGEVAGGRCRWARRSGAIATSSARCRRQAASMRGRPSVTRSCAGYTTHPSRTCSLCMRFADGNVPPLVSSTSAATLLYCCLSSSLAWLGCGRGVGAVCAWRLARVCAMRRPVLAGLAAGLAAAWTTTRAPGCMAPRAAGAVSMRAIGMPPSPARRMRASLAGYRGRVTAVVSIGFRRQQTKISSAQLAQDTRAIATAMWGLGTTQ